MTANGELSRSGRRESFRVVLLSLLYLVGWCCLPSPLLGRGALFSAPNRPVFFFWEPAPPKWRRRKAARHPVQQVFTTIKSAWMRLMKWNLAWLGQCVVESRWVLDIGCVDRTPTHSTHLCSTVCSQARNAHLALGSSHTDCSALFVRLKKSSVIWCRTCLFRCCSRTFRSPRAHHLLHSLFLLPRHQNTQHNRDNKNNSKNTQYIMHISRLSQSASSAIKNHSGVKTCRVAENPTTTTPILWRMWVST